MAFSSGSTRSILNSVTTLMPFCSRMSPSRPAAMGLVKRSGQRCRQCQFDAVPHALLVEVVVGQEEEFQRRDRALDGHFGHVEDQTPTLPCAQKAVKSNGAVNRVEIEDALAPFMLFQSRRLFGNRARSGGNDEIVVIEVTIVLLDANPIVVRFRWPRSRR